MRKVLFLLLVICMVVVGCTSETVKHEENEKDPQSVFVLEDIRYKLFETQNMWTFIKLDTQTGQIWQIQYSVEGEEKRFEYELNRQILVEEGSEQINGRFELYPTKNIYNFVLLDQISGQCWQVQWSFDEDKRMVLPIKPQNGIQNLK